MSKFEPPPYVRTQAEKLWMTLIESGGDPEKVTKALDDAASDGPSTFMFVAGTALTLFFTSTWPAVLAQLEAEGVTGDQVATGIAAGMVQQVSDYLRGDVEPEGV